MDEAFRAWLLSHAPFAALVGRQADWGVRPQGAALPGVALHLASAVPGMKMTGPTGWRRDRVQADCFARTYKAARDIADTLGGDAGLLVGFRGDLPGLRIRTFVISRRSGEDSDKQGPVHLASLDVMVWHTPLPVGETP